MTKLEYFSLIIVLKWTGGVAISTYTYVYIYRWMYVYISHCCNSTLSYVDIKCFSRKKKHEFYFSLILFLKSSQMHLILRFDYYLQLAQILNLEVK